VRVGTLTQLRQKGQAPGETRDGWASTRNIRLMIFLRGRISLTQRLSSPPPPHSLHKTSHFSPHSQFGPVTLESSSNVGPPFAAHAPEIYTQTRHYENATAWIFTFFPVFALNRAFGPSTKETKPKREN